MPVFKINKKFIPIKIHFFLYSAAVVPLLFFGPTIAKQIGYSSVTVGCMYTVLLLSGVVLRTSFGGFADKFKLRKIVLLISLLVCLITNLSMIFLSTAVAKKNVTFLCHSETHINLCNMKTSSIDRLKKVNPDGIVNCEFFCQTDSIFVHEICSTWKVTNYCGNLDNHSILNNNNSVINNFILPVNNSSNPFAKKAVVSSNQNFIFTTLINYKHISSSENCIFGKIEELNLTSFGDVIIPKCNIRRNISCTMKCYNDEFMSALQENSDIKHDLYKSEFWILFLIYEISWISAVISTSMTDTICIELLGDEPHKYGKQRMYGATGCGCVSLSCGWLVDFFSDNSYEKNYYVLFYVSSVLFFCDIILIYFIKVEQKTAPVSVFKDVKVLFYNLKTVIFASWCLLTGIFHGVIWNFLFWYLEDISTIEDLKWSKTLQGIDIFIVTFIGEMPFFFISGWIIKKYGHVNIMSVVLLANVIRMFGYSMLTRPVWVLAIEWINGFAFSMGYVALVSYSNAIAVPGTESTVQALFSSIFDGLGIALGGSLGGLIKNEYGGRIMFNILGYISFTAFVLHVLIQFALKSYIPAYNESNVNNTVISYSSPKDAIKISKDGV